MDVKMTIIFCCLILAMQNAMVYFALKLHVTTSTYEAVELIQNHNETVMSNVEWSCTK